MFHAPTRFLRAIAPGLALGMLFTLVACSPPVTREDVHKVGRRNAKLHAVNQLKLKVETEDVSGHPDNPQWEQYWASIEQFNDPEAKRWNDQIHRLYAYYVLPPADEWGEPTGKAVWIFTDRVDGEVRGVLQTDRGRAKLGG